MVPLAFLDEHLMLVKLEGRAAQLRKEAVRGVAHPASARGTPDAGFAGSTRQRPVRMPRPPRRAAMGGMRASAPNCVHGRRVRLAVTRPDLQTVALVAKH